MIHEGYHGIFFSDSQYRSESFNTWNALSELEQAPVKMLAPGGVIPVPRPLMTTDEKGITLAQCREKLGVDGEEFAVGGKGVKIAVVDTGIDLQHPAFKQAKDDDRLEYKRVPGTGPAKDRDSIGHGSHVTGIAAGSDTEGTNTGLAPKAAMVTATITLLPPIAPAVVTLAEQRTTGDVIEVLAVELPAPGFVVIREDDQGEAGRFLGVSSLLPEGSSANVQVTLDDRFDISAILFASIYIDRDGDGTLMVGPGSSDQIAQGADGLEATIGVPVTAVPLGPVQLVAADQESEGTEVAVTVTLPAPGFLVLKTNAAGAPGTVVAVSDLLALGTADVVFLLDPALTEDTTFWVEVRIDLDGNGELDENDPLGITAADDVARTSFLVTLPVPEDEGTDS